MSTIRTNTLLHSDGTTTTEPSIPALDQRMASAWVNFNGTGTVAIRDSYNVSSITDIGTGIYDVNFSTSMADSNYVALISTNENLDDTPWVHSDSLTSSYQIRTYDGAAYIDISKVMSVVFSN